MQPQRLGDLRLALRLQVFGTGGGNESGLGETLILEGGALAHELGAGGRQLLLGLERLDLDIGVGKVEQNGLRLHALQAERSEEHTSELQSQSNLVCRLLLEKKSLIDYTASDIVIPLGHSVVHFIANV